MSRPLRFVIYRRLFGQWRWKLLAGNNRKIAHGGESFHNLADCEASVELVRGSSDARIEIER